MSSPVVSSDTSACVGSFKQVVEHDPGVDEVLVLLDFTDLAGFVEWTSGRTAVGETVPDLGDAGFLGPKGADEYNMLCFRKESRAVRVAAGSGGASVSTEDLRKIADLIASRLE